MGIKVVKSQAAKRKILTRKILSLPLDNIIQRDNMRSQYRETDLAELMTSMRQNGLLQPIGVKDIGNDEFEILFGNRRLMAAEKLGWEEIDAQVLEAETDADMLIIHAIENLHRLDVPLTDQGRIFQQLIDMGLKKSEVAARMGILLRAVSDALTAYQHVPLKYRDKVVPRGIGKPNKREGKVRPTAAMVIESMRKMGKVNKSQAEALYDFASEDETDARHLRVLGELMRTGFTPSEARELVADIKTVTISLSVDKKIVADLENRYKMSYHGILYSILAEHKELGIVAAGNKVKTQIMEKLGLTKEQIKELKG